MRLSAPYTWLVITCLSLLSCQPTVEKTPQVLLDSSKIFLGKHLFFETALSATNTKSCANCHNPVLAFTDGYKKSPGIFGDLHTRNTPSLLNLSSQSHFNLANPDLGKTTDQMSIPLFGKHPIEMGADSTDLSTLLKLFQNPPYKTLLQEAYQLSYEQINWSIIKDAIATYILSLNSTSAPFDAFLAGDTTAISTSAQEGWKLFHHDFGCISCHQLPHLGAHKGMLTEKQFANIGLYNYDDGNYPLVDQGIFNLTGKKHDKGKFKIPSLRNVGFTAPYFHDGSAETLWDVITVYENGGRNITYGPWKGDGRNNPYKSITRIPMTLQQKLQLLDFLATLNDSTLFTNPHFQSPHTL